MADKPQNDFDADAFDIIKPDHARSAEEFMEDIRHTPAKGGSVIVYSGDLDANKMKLLLEKSKKARSDDEADRLWVESHTLDVQSSDRTIVRVAISGDDRDVIRKYAQNVRVTGKRHLGSVDPKATGTELMESGADSGLPQWLAAVNVIFNLRRV